MRSNAGMADRGTSTCAKRKSPPPVNTLAWLAWLEPVLSDVIRCMYFLLVIQTPHFIK